MSTKAPASDRSSTPDEKLITELSQGLPERWKHQQKTVDFALARDAVFDTSDPGTGKTRGHIDVFTDRLAAGTSSKLLVVCPKSLMGPAWQADLRKFAPGLLPSLAFAEVREKAFEVDRPVYIINTDGVKWLAKKTPTWMKRHFGLNATLIIDESTAFKHHTSQRSRAAKKVAKYFKYRTLMTGTPITSSVTDIWHQLLLLDQGQRLGRNFTAFRNSVQTPVMMGSFTRWADKEGVEEILSFMIRDLTIRHQFEEVMDVPPNYSRPLGFTLSSRVAEAYRQMAEEAYLQLASGDVSAVNAAVLAGKLLQIASGAVYDSHGDVHVIDTERHALVTDLVEERESSVVFFNWTHQRDELVKQATKRRLSHAVIDGTVAHAERTRIVEAFQEGDLRAVYLHPATGAHGLTLTRGTATIWASPRYEPDFLKQGLHRVYRGGQTRKTENILVEAADTIEPGVYKVLNTKYDRMVNLLSLLKEQKNEP